MLKFSSNVSGVLRKVFKLSSEASECKPLSPSSPPKWLAPRRQRGCTLWCATSTHLHTLRTKAVSLTMEARQLYALWSSFFSARTTW